MWSAILGAFWLVPAGLLPGGSWTWRRGLWAVAFIALIQAIGASYFAAHKPAHEQHRSPTDDNKLEGWRNPMVDAVGMTYGVAFFVFIPIDVFCLHLLPRPSLAVAIAGAVISVVGLLVMNAAVVQHAATPNTRDQPTNGQHIIDSGVYGVVRHPMYLGVWLWLSGAAVWLESFAALIAALGVLAFILVRIEIEESHMRRHLPGYTAYTRRVPRR